MLAKLGVVCQRRRLTPTNYAVEAPNGIIVPPVNANSTGTAIRAILDGTSKTIMIGESKEQAISSWYDGTTAWQVATPMGNTTNFYNYAQNGNTCVQPQKVLLTGQNSGVQYAFWTTAPAGIQIGTPCLNYGRQDNTNYAGSIFLHDPVGRSLEIWSQQRPQRRYCAARLG